MKSNYDDLFEGMEKELAIPVGTTTNSLTTHEQSKSKALIKKTQQELLSNSDSALKNAEYVKFELMESIQSTKSILDKLEMEIKVGSEPRVYEVYSTLNDSLTRKIEQIRILDESIDSSQNRAYTKMLNLIKLYQAQEKIELQAQRQVAQQEKETRASANGNVNMSSKDMIALMKTITRHPSSLDNYDDVAYQVTEDDLQ